MLIESICYSDGSPSTYIPSTSGYRLCLLKPSGKNVTYHYSNLLVKSVLKNGRGLRKKPESIFLQMSSCFLRICGQTPVPNVTSCSGHRLLPLPAFRGTWLREKAPVLLRYPSSALSSSKTFRKSSSKTRPLPNQSHFEVEPTSGPSAENSVQEDFVCLIEGFPKFRGVCCEWITICPATSPWGPTVTTLGSQQPLGTELPSSPRLGSHSP